MASLYAPSAAFNYVKKMIKNMPIQDIRAQVLDDTLKMMWEAAPWAFSIGSFPDVTIVANQQDYTVAIPATFRKLQHAYITDSTGQTQRSAIEIVPLIEAGGPPGQISSVAISGTPGMSGTMRTYPTWGAVRVGATLKIISQYKKVAPTITDLNYNTPGVQVFDDDWFWVYNSGVLYQAYLYGDDQRAGGASMGANGQWQFTGQRAVFEANLQFMREHEPLCNYTGRLVPEPKQK